MSSVDRIIDELNGVPPAARALIDAAAVLRQVDWEAFLPERGRYLSPPALRAARAAIELIQAIDAPDLIR